MITLGAGAMADLVKQPPSSARKQTSARHQGERAVKHTLVEAPLASLDCSITEPIDDKKTRKIFDTPTLTSYLDYDELSDMIDDSLFEITNRGCLSKTIFCPDQAKIAQAPPMSTNVNIQAKQSTKILEKHEDPRELIVQSYSRPSMVNQVRPIASRQPYDYSSTTRVPLLAGKAQTRASSKESSMAGAGADRAGRVKTDETIISRKTRSNPDVNKPDQLSGLSASGEQSAKEQRKRFTFNIFNFFSNNAAHQKQVQEYQQPVLADETQPAHTKAKRLATKMPADGLSSSIRARNGVSRLSTDLKSKPRDSIKLTNQRRRKKSTSLAKQQENGQNSNCIHEGNNNSRDFSGNNIRLSCSVSDFRRANQASGGLEQEKANERAVGGQVGGSTGELLLDLSVHRHSRATDASSGRPEEDSSVLEPSRSRQMTVRQTKSVKFTTLPDRVVMVSPANNVASMGSHHLRHYHYHHHHRSARARPSCSASDHLGSLPRSLNPIECSSRADKSLPVPIIKRSSSAGRKLSSSYSQTDSSKNLKELLARYEANSDLVVAINEKLKLTDTIASPMSALDDYKNADTTRRSRPASTANRRPARLSQMAKPGTCEKKEQQASCDSNLDKCRRTVTSSTDEPTSAAGANAKQSTSGTRSAMPLTQHQPHQQQLHVNAHIMNDPIPVKSTVPMTLPSPPSASSINHQSLYPESKTALDTAELTYVAGDWINKHPYELA